MRLARFGAVGEERPAVLLDDATLLDVSTFVDDYDRAFFARGGLERLQGVLDTHGADLPRVAVDSVRIGAPIARPGKVLCIGLNYADHAAESGMPIPEEPILFMKGTDTVVGPFDDIYIPRGSEKTDWEVELGVVIGAPARYLADRDAARGVIAGYCVSHDVSERAYQLERGGQWDKGKSCERFNPLGPWLVTADEIADPQDLGMELDVNGEPAQRGSTKTMIFDVLELVRYLSQFLVLEPGDLVNTGTPPGVGMGHNPPRYLRAGDEVTLGITGLGRQRQRFVPAP
ncbi:fumarylacetoacetate hydrolase family protein [Catenulispora subtropica]|uniref:Fumarylacetoacetate hydrolase family protein n=1 Tax=Catenulispora subtropica TaxID=450798 RepID=A0ABN2T2H5_9ACTN